MQTLCFEIEGLKKYEIKTWESGCCRNLANLKVVNEKAYWQNSGTINIKDYILVSKNSGITDRIIKIVRAIRKITEGFVVAEDYLIDEHHISLDIDKLWFNTENDLIKLLPGASDKEYIIRIGDLLTELAFEDIGKIIIDKNRESSMTYKDLLSFLSLYELELR